MSQKCASSIPSSPIAVDAAVKARPVATTRGAPNRVISRPVKKLGAYIAMMCRCRPKLDESCDRPHKRERLARGKRVADDGTGCVHDGGIRPGKRLRNRKPQHIGTARTERGYETDRSRGFSV